MPFKIRLKAEHVDIDPLQFDPSKCMLGDSTVALLADIASALAIQPKGHARIATLLSCTGDGRTIGLIDVHAGKLDHHLGTYDQAGGISGDYILPPPDADMLVSVNIINETNATLMILPMAQIGTINFQNIRPDLDGLPLIHGEEPLVSANFAPNHIDADEPPAYAHSASNGVGLKADIADDVEIAPGASVLIPTGLTVTAFGEVEPQIRTITGLPRTIAIHNLPTAAAGEMQKIELLLTNVGSDPVTIRPSDNIAQMIFAPVIRAALDFSSAEAAPAAPHSINA